MINFFTKNEIILGGTWGGEGRGAKQKVHEFNYIFSRTNKIDIENFVFNIVCTIHTSI